MPGGVISGLFRYGESELDPAVQAEILLESARNEARVAILELLVALGFFLWPDIDDSAYRYVVFFAIITVIPLLIDAALRRAAARRLLKGRRAVGAPEPTAPPGGRARAGR